jgi:hypothetical protein
VSFFVAPDTKARYHAFGEGGGRSLASEHGTPVAAVGEAGLRTIFHELAGRLLADLESGDRPRAREGATTE